MAGWALFARYLAQVIKRGPTIVRTRSLAAADGAIRDKRYHFRLLGTEVVVDFETTSIGVVRELYGRRAYFSVPGFDISDEDTVLDLGAESGTFTVLAAKLAKRVVAVECQSEFIRFIKHNLALNRCSANVSVEFAVIGGRTGAVSEERASNYGTDSPRISMSELIKKHQLGVIDFLKIDIEGSEFDLFAADPRWLRQVRRIAMEVHPQFGRIGDILSTLADYGFETRQLTGDTQQPIAAIELASVGYLFANRPVGQTSVA